MFVVRAVRHSARLERAELVYLRSTGDDVFPYDWVGEYESGGVPHRFVGAYQAAIALTQTSLVNVTSVYIVALDQTYIDETFQ